MVYMEAMVVAVKALERAALAAWAVVSWAMVAVEALERAAAAA